VEPSPQCFSVYCAPSLAPGSLWCSFGSKAYYLTNLILVTSITLISCLVSLPVRSATQSTIISSASSQAGMAVGAGEVIKDAKYQNIGNNIQ